MQDRTLAWSLEPRLEVAGGDRNIKGRRRNLGDRLGLLCARGAGKLQEEGRQEHGGGGGGLGLSQELGLRTRRDQAGAAELSTALDAANTG